MPGRIPGPLGVDANGWRIAHRRMDISHELGSRDVLRPALA